MPTQLQSYALVSRFVGIVLSSFILLCARSSYASVSTLPVVDSSIIIIPDQMLLNGDVATKANTAGHCTQNWLSNTPDGSIMLGVNPLSCNPQEWRGGSAQAEVYLEDVYHPTLFILKVFWPDRDGKGIHSPERDQVMSITLDGQPLWGKRTTQLSTFNDYYAAEHEPLLTTIVVRQSMTHTLSFSVPPRTAWDLSQIELVAYPYPATIKGIGYSPYRDCQYPGGSVIPALRDLQEDLFRLVHTSNAIRTYSATGINGQVPALANAVGLPVFAGAWLDIPKATVAQDDAEIQALINLACTTDLRGMIVGNEYYLRHRTSADINYLRERIRQVKNGIRTQCGKEIPVTTAEIDNLMFTWESDASTVVTGINPLYRPILDELDFVLVHIYPFWSKLPIEGAAAYTVGRYKAMKALLEQAYPGQNKRLIIGEAGWPSGGARTSPDSAAVPSMENQRRYLLEFLPLAEREGVEFMYFDAFDELWKIEEPGGVGQRWGYSYPDRTAKYNFYGVLLSAKQLFPNTVYLATMAAQAAAGASQSTAQWIDPLALPPTIRTDSVLGFPIYTEWPMAPDNFVPSGWMGDTSTIGMYQCERRNPHSGEMAIRVSFAPTSTLGWSGVYWQHPENNWGTLQGGHTFTDANRLTFWVRGERGGEVVEFVVGGLGKSTDPYADTIRPARSSGPLILSNKWEQAEINLTGADTRRVIGAFAWVAGRCHNAQPITFYLDDIAFDFSPSHDPLPVLARRPFYVYSDDDPSCNHFVPSGWMGDLNDIVLNPSWNESPQSGTTAISVAYSALGSNSKGWAGVYWQEPENNWGKIDGGFDLSWANKLTFWAKGKVGGEKVRFFTGGVGINGDSYPDSLRPALSTGFIRLEPTWQFYTLDLRGQDLSRVSGGFGLATDRCANPNGATFYLDNIRFEYDPNMPPPPSPGPTFPVYTDAAAQDNHFIPSGWLGDAKVPGRVSLTECWYENPHSGQTAIKIAYTQSVEWAGVYWVHPAENWGDRPGGYDLTGADRLTFWARSDTPNARVTFFIGAIGYPVDIQGNADCSNPSEPYPDSVCPKLQQTETLSAAWTKYTIPLPQARDLSKVVGGFGWTAQSAVTFYLDDIVYELD